MYKSSIGEIKIMEIIKDSLINGVRRTLSDAEAKDADTFHRERFAFAWVDGILTFNENNNDGRDHEHWLKEDFGITEEQFENINRGYMKPTYIQLFKGSSFKPVDTSEISVSDFKKLCEVHGSRYGTDKVEIRNGVKVGKVGEIWPPISVIGIFDT